MMQMPPQQETNLAVVVIPGRNENNVSVHAEPAFPSSNVSPSPCASAPDADEPPALIKFSFLRRSLYPVTLKVTLSVNGCTQ